MELLPNCYTDLCVDGKWFHYDHGDNEVFMLAGACPVTFELASQPATEAELEQHLQEITSQIK